MDEAFRTVIDSGVLGALVVIFGGVIAYMYRENRKLSDARLADSKEVTTKVIEPLEAIKKLIQEQGDERKKENRDVINTVDNSKSRSN